MNVAIASVGLATSQGSVQDISSGARPLRSPAKLPWPAGKWAACHSSHSATGIEPLLTGRDRWRALAGRALEECFGGTQPSQQTPLLLASCNGAADGFEPTAWRHAFDSKSLLAGTPWAGQSLPVFSGSCNSGSHALYMAVQLLRAGYSKEVIVLAVDILSRASHDNFEVLRVLTDEPMPWQSASSGFILGEAAVALHLVRTERDDRDTHLLDGPVLASDLADHDGLSTVLSELRLSDLKLILGQGTGPFESDGMELRALRRGVSQAVPLATPLVRFGHTLGASSLLSVALAVLARRGNSIGGGAVPVLTMASPSATDGRPLFKGYAQGDNILVTCRAMSGACAAACIGASRESGPRTVRGWRTPGELGPLMHSALRQVSALALRYRPQAPTDLLVVRMDEPLLPDERASIGGRLLPSAVLELTPGFVPQLIARCWGFTGGALCLVGEAGADKATKEMMRAVEQCGLAVSRINLRGGVDEREIEWNA
ncbi:MAG TPA: beta-ketoacyl synthase N-terminal-like domain-containing protein [Pyrinomonadaceae bacterium]|nr:beta-ketoacyl synthase N-terminal-like domain-containing protein [Pyrinomonadaceae bacterium]